MGSSGAQNPNWQRWQPRAIILSHQSGASALQSGLSIFRVPIPDSRLRVKISLIFQFAIAANEGFVFPSATLWLSGRDIEDAGFSGDAKPLSNIEGESGAPITIPADNGLIGYSREFVSSADYIEGQLTVNGAAGFEGWWILQTKYQPYSVSFSPEEWDLIRAQCNPESNGRINLG